MHPAPGVVLGPDGKPCKVCTAFRNWKPKVQKDAHASSSAAAAAPRPSTPTSADSSSLLAAPTREHCPPDVEQLGRATWTFLHTTAAYYPERPTPLQRAHMLGLLHALPELYPCSHCATDLAHSMRDHPPDVSGRVALSRWLCARHNDVNDTLGKPRFDCDRTDERWRDGPRDGSCD
jgi:FAD-linked sulfhydryl oxidase